jgi:hypothetical protein
MEKVVHWHEPWIGIPVGLRWSRGQVGRRTRHGNSSCEVLEQAGGAENLMESSPWAERWREGSVAVKTDGGEKNLVGRTAGARTKRFELQNGGGGGGARCNAIL